VDFYDGFDNWQDAVRASCRTLQCDGSVTEQYAEAIIDNILRYGPYIVITDNLAIPHTKAGAEGVARSAISFTKVRRPVSFEPGNPEYDACLLFTLAARDMDEHFENMEKLGNMLLDESLLRRLNDVNDIEALRRLADECGQEPRPEY